MHFITQQHNKAVFIPIVFILVNLWIYPVADLGDPRFSAFFRFSTGAIILFAIALWRENKWIALFMLLSYFSSIFPFSTKHSTHAWNAVLIGCLWFYVLVQFLNKDKYIIWVLDAICIVALCNVAMITSQTFGFDPIFKPRFETNLKPIVGFLSNRNEVSAFLAISIPAFFRPKWKWLVPVCFAGLFLSKSTGGMLAAIVMVSVYFLIKDGREGWTKNFIYLFPLLVLFYVFLIYADPSTYSWFHNDRLEAWYHGIVLGSQHWLFGSGIGHWKIVFKNLSIYNQWFDHAHNEFIQTVFELGIFSVVIFAGYFYDLITRYKKIAIIPISAIIVIVVNSLINFPMHIAQTAVLIMTYMAICEVSLRETA